MSSIARRLIWRRPVLLVLASISLVRPVPAFTTARPTVFSWFRQHRTKRNLSMSAKLDSPSAQRNKEPIWDILSTKVLSSFPKKDEPIKVLEVAAGCGVHSLHFSLKLNEQQTKFIWQPSDPEESSRASIQAYLDENDALEGKLQPPVNIFLTENGPTDTSVIQDTLDLMLCINMIHISPWQATLGLVKLAGEKLVPGGILYLYGPYKVNGEAVDSNLRFDQSLKSRDPSWGVRDLEEVLKAAGKNGLVHIETIEMPANNLSVILQKR